MNRLDPDATIVPAEGGRLAFVSPLLSLRHDSAYTVTIVGAVDVLDRALVAAPVTFVTVGEPQSASNGSDEESWVPDERSRANGCAPSAQHHRGNRWPRCWPRRA